jgi:hypothetical protein
MSSSSVAGSAFSKLLEVSATRSDCLPGRGGRYPILTPASKNRNARVGRENESSWTYDTDVEINCEYLSIACLEGGPGPLGEGETRPVGLEVRSTVATALLG